MVSQLKTNQIQTFCPCTFVNCSCPLFPCKKGSQHKWTQQGEWLSKQLLIHFHEQWERKMKQSWRLHQWAEVRGKGTSHSDIGVFYLSVVQQQQISYEILNLDNDSPAGSLLMIYPFSSFFIRTNVANFMVVAILYIYIYSVSAFVWVSIFPLVFQWNPWLNKITKKKPEKKNKRNPENLKKNTFHALCHWRVRLQHTSPVHNLSTPR